MLLHILFICNVEMHYNLKHYTVYWNVLGHINADTKYCLSFILLCMSHRSSCDNNLFCHINIFILKNFS